MKIESYKQFGGVHPETAAFTNVLASQGVVSAHSNESLSEAMIFGVAGGLGCGYILWEFKAYDSAILVMGFQNRWNYPIEYYGDLCQRLGLSAEFRDTGGKKKAVQDLDDLLASGYPAIAWVDQASLPYFFMRPMYDGCFGHFVTVFGKEEDGYLVDDRAQKPFAVEKGALNQARSRISSYKNRLLSVNAADKEIPLDKAIVTGLLDCIDYMGRDSQTFAIPVYKKWARLMTDLKNKKGWPTVFKDQNGLYSTLRSIYEGVELFGTGGGGLRFMYADFLEEAAPIINNTGLLVCAENYRICGQLWSSFAEAVLPDSVPGLAETRKLLNKKHQIFNQQGGEGLEELHQVSEELIAKEEAMNKDLGLTENELNDLFSSMQDHLYGIYNAELEALDSLRLAVS